jgi:hypothetical protein
MSFGSSNVRVRPVATQFYFPLRVPLTVGLFLLLPGTVLGGSITGGVRERNTNTPISGATVRLEQNGQIRYTTTTNSSGVYNLTSVQNGTYNLVCLKLSCYQNWGPSPRTLGDLTGQNIVMDRFASITGGVRDAPSSAPINGATVRLEQNGQIMYETTTDGAGVYSFDCIPPGTYDLVGLELSCHVNWSSPRTLNLNDHLAGQNIAMDKFASISGGVRDAPSGAPVGGATVRLEQNGQIIYTTHADANGVYSFSCVAPGTYNLVSLELSCHVNWSSSRALLANDVLTAQNIAMDKFASIAGGVRDAATSQPIAGATVRLEQNGQIIFTTVADGGGVYSFSCVPPGSYNLVALKLGQYFNWSSPRTLNANDVLTGQNIAMTVMPHLSGGIRDGCQTTSVPVGGVTISLTGPINATTTSDLYSGVYEFDYLPNGTYHVHISDLPGQYSVAAGDADRDVTMNGTNVDFFNGRMLPYESIAGQSSSYETGKPVANDRITITSLATNQATTVFTDGDGNYVSPPLAQGTYSIGAGSCDDKVYLNSALGCGGLAGIDFQQKGLVDVLSFSATGGGDGHSVVLNWAGGNGQTSTYAVYRGSSSEGPFDFVGNSQPPYTDTGLQCRESRWYAVASVNGCNRVGAPSVALVGTNSKCLPIVVLLAPSDGAAVDLPETFS